MAGSLGRRCSRGVIALVLVLIAVVAPPSLRRRRRPKLHMVLTADWDQPLPHEDWHGLDRQSEDVAETEKD